jgi:cytochrome oxidase Cu insertion factor (SCO1/SenC/PrrC family)
MTQTKSRLFLLFLFAVCALPLILSYAAYYVWPPERRMNYGELLDMRVVQLTGMIALDGKPFVDADANGKWLLLLIEPGACGDDCQRLMYAMRQTRLAMGVKRAGLETLWLVADNTQPSDHVLAQLQGMHVARADASTVALLPAPAQGRIFLLDPSGRLVLRYPASPEPARMVRDLARLLDVKKI